MSSYVSKYSSSFYSPADEAACHCAIIRKVGICTSAIFTGAALYINLVEQPARLQLETSAALKQFKESYKRAVPMQAGLATVSGLFGIGSAIKTGEKAWGIGAALMLANLPYTLIWILPLNKRLLATEEAAADTNTRADLQRWGRLHAVRTALGFAAIGVFLYAVSKE